MKLPSGNVSATLFIPLWSRAYTTKKYPSLLEDLESVRIVAESTFDFSGIHDEQEYYNLAAAFRAANFDMEIRQYLDQYPEAIVVSIGSGLDTTFFRVDNGRLTWYDLDLPEVIALREEYIGKNDRVHTISRSCFDYGWVDEIPYDSAKGLIFVLGGVLYYFREEWVREFLRDMAERFPGAQMIFDSTSKAGILISNRYVKKTGNDGARLYFGLNNAVRFFASVSPKIRLLAAYPFYSLIPPDRSWAASARFRMGFSDFFRMVKLVRVEFI